jgi:hypothetical protein
MDENFEKRNKAQDENDLIAGKILKKYSNQNVKVLVDDKYEDYNTMQLIVDTINNKTLANDEVTILKKYLERRYPYIDDNYDLKIAIAKLLSYAVNK